MKKLAITMGVVGCLMIIVGIIMIVIPRISENKNKERCYSLSLYKFYRDDNCNKYWNYEIEK